MPDEVNRQWVLRERPAGMVDDSTFELRESPRPAPGDGEFLVRNLLLSLDPTMRGWISDRATYMAPVAIGEVMRGGTVARVLESNHPDFEPGELVLGAFGWQDYAVSSGDGEIAVRKVPEGVPPTWPLSVLGPTSITAYFGLREIGKPEPGETVVVSAAAGATGSIAGQIAKIDGCRVIGIAGGKSKCEWLTGELGFDAAIDYKSEDVGARLRELCPNGIDVFWDNVGGEILEAALANIAMRGRVVLCGAISVYNELEHPPPGPSNYLNLLVQRGRMEGFIVLDYFDRIDEALAEMVPWVVEGRIHFREDVRDGLETAPSALRSLFEGANEGKLLVKIAEP